MKRRTRPKLVHVTAKVVVVRLVKVRAHKRVTGGSRPEQQAGTTGQ